MSKANKLVSAGLITSSAVGGLGPDALANLESLTDDEVDTLIRINDKLGGDGSLLVRDDDGNIKPDIIF